jgi:hypothetical protein
MLALVIAEGAAIAVLALLVAGLLRSHAEILRALHDLGAGIDDGAGPHQHPARITTSTVQGAAHDLVGSRLDGSGVAVAVTGVPHDSLLVFLSSGCLSCRPFWDGVGSVSAPAGVRTVVVVQDEDSRPRLRDLAGDDGDVVVSSRAWSDYGVPGSPHVVLVHGPTGAIAGEGTGQSLDQVVDLLTQAGEGRAADPRDNPQRIDLELTASGIGPGHASLRPPETG